jgi:hypothetical protein
MEGVKGGGGRRAIDIKGGGQGVSVVAFWHLCWKGGRVGRERSRGTHTPIFPGVLQHTATHCNTLQHTATHCNTLQHTATHCNTHTFRCDINWDGAFNTQHPK